MGAIANLNDLTDYVNSIGKKARVAKFTKVRCITTGKIYDSIKEAADEFGLAHSNIVACCNGRRSTCGGMRWEYFK